MKEQAKKLIYLAVIAFVLAVIFKLGGIVVGPIFPATLLKVTNTLLLFAIACALV